ncbi:MAG: hypothetical protein F6K55_44695 [Moorea sp. SIO4A3]|nr:hypothetical protein [Moorena sp. SIO4A3]
MPIYSLSTLYSAAPDSRFPIPYSLLFYFYPDKKSLIFLLSKKINLFNKIKNFPDNQ